MTVQLELRNRYPELSETNKKIANFVLESPNQFLKLNAVEIAEYAQTSSASVIRFVKSLGYQGLEDFKIQLALSTKNDQLEAMIDPIISQADNIDVLCEKLDSLASNSLRDLFYQLDKQALEAAINIIRSSKKVYLLGIGASSLPAYDLYHKLNRANIPAIFNFDTHMTCEFLNYINQDDVVIAFSYSGQTAEVIYPVQIAKDKGAPVISVTRQQPSVLSDLSTIALHVPNNEMLTRVGAIASKFTSMLVADLLYLGTIQSNLEKVEQGLLDTSRLTKVMKIENRKD